MARVKNLDQLTGRVGNLSFYSLKGSDKVFVRTKGGPSAYKIKNHESFEPVRRNNREFGGCSSMASLIRQAFASLDHLADYNLSPALTSLAKSIQKGDKEYETGQRRIQLSKYRYVLQGFEFSKQMRFSSLLRVPLHTSLDRDTMSATLHIPAFATDFGLDLDNDFMQAAIVAGVFRISVALGLVADMALDGNANRYVPVNERTGYNFNRKVHTDWVSTKGSMMEQDLTVTLGDTDLPGGMQEEDTLLMTVAVEFGMPDALGEMMPIRKTGAAVVMGAF